MAEWKDDLMRGHENMEITRWYGPTFEGFMRDDVMYIQAAANIHKPRAMSYFNLRPSRSICNMRSDARA